MKIIHIYKDFDPTKGGVARHIDTLSSTQSESGHEIVVLAPNPKLVTTPYKSEKFTLNSALRNIKQSDIAHLHGARMPITAFCTLLCLLLRTPYVYTPHCYYDSETTLNKFAKMLWDNIVERIIVSFARMTILLNDSWLDYYKTKRLPTINTTVIPNCISYGELVKRISQTYNKELPNRSPNILYIGRLDPVKRVDDLIKAINTSVLKNSFLHIIGEGPDKERLVNLVHEQDLKNRVLFYGYLDDSSAFSIANSADVFVLPSESEGLPTILLEMILMKKPVIFSNIAGNMAIANKIGLNSSFELFNIEDMSLKISNFNDYKINADHLRLLRNHFTWENRAKDICKIYEKSIAK